MATFDRFEEIVAWQRARELARAVYRLTRGRAFLRDYALANQLRRSAVSVMANIAEGFERDGRREFLQFLSVAKGSIGELKSHLYVCRDEGMIEESAFEDVRKKIDHAANTIGALMKYLRSSSFRGKRFVQS